MKLVSLILCTTLRRTLTMYEGIGGWRVLLRRPGYATSLSLLVHPSRRWRISHLMNTATSRVSLSLHYNGSVMRDWYLQVRILEIHLEGDAGLVPKKVTSDDSLHSVTIRYRKSCQVQHTIKFVQNPAQIRSRGD
ncbi:hypothetical protein LINPERPRIM_LOCUS43823 [Linum perenne]